MGKEAAPYRPDRPGNSIHPAEGVKHDASLICVHGREVVSISKEWFTWGDCYALDIADSADEMLALAVVLAIDAVHAQANAAAAST